MTIALGDDWGSYYLDSNNSVNFCMRAVGPFRAWTNFWYFRWTLIVTDVAYLLGRVWSFLSASSIGGFEGVLERSMEQEIAEML